MNGIFVVGIWGIYPWGVRMNMGQGDYRDLWLVTAVFCAVTAVFIRMGTCAVVLRSESLLVINPIGSKEVRYDGIRKMVAGPGVALKIVTVRDESLVPVAFGGSLVDYRFATSELAATAIRERLPPKPKSVVDAKPVERTLVRPCRSADVILAIGVVAALVGGVMGAIG
ncbi:hypothetical protein [Streptomyces sp. 351MFTsu5.1]|uniref:hypothetical protein n=1 Tax=Streptomyces sp. 351MFTsu5.1 TaxID=1172180 RepID=UPI001F23478C|nr:hypothetical protein [Streptomyces sp. 351MFTsu5.1]